MRNRQKEILVLFENDTDKVMTKSEIIKEGKIAYYYNTKKHVGDTLTRMVKNGSLIRESRGKYKLGSGVKEQPENQLKLL